MDLCENIPVWVAGKPTQESCEITARGFAHTRIGGGEAVPVFSTPCKKDWH